MRYPNGIVPNTKYSRGGGFCRHSIHVITEILVAPYRFYVNIPKQLKTKNLK